MRYYAVVLMLMLASCKDDILIVGNGSSGSTFTLKTGQTVTIQPGNMKVGFEQVANDSRCPEGAMCFWEGMARLRMWLLPPVADTVFIQPQINGHVTQKDTCCQQYVDTLGYRLKLMQLDPYPHIGVPLPIPQNAYLAYLKVWNLSK